ncbi:UNVERIFIED_CONTAM: hypothetical protein FKN15_048029 [Acipenser sinensis]
MTSCSYTASSEYVYLYWYQQNSNRAPEYTLFKEPAHEVNYRNPGSLKEKMTTSREVASVVLTAKKPNEDELDILKQNREKELDQRRNTFRWKTYAEGMPKCVDIKKTCNLPLDVQFSFSKNTEFQFTVTSA